RSPSSQWGGHRGAPHEGIITVKGAPKAVIGRLRGAHGKDPSAGRHHVGLDPPICSWPAAREVRHRIRIVALRIDIWPIVFRRPNCQYILGGAWRADGLGARAGIPGGIE